MKPGASGAPCEAERESNPKDDFLNLFHGYCYIYFFLLLVEPIFTICIFLQIILIKIKHQYSCI